MAAEKQIDTNKLLQLTVHWGAAAGPWATAVPCSKTAAAKWQIRGAKSTYNGNQLACLFWPRQSKNNQSDESSESDTLAILSLPLHCCLCTVTDIWLNVTFNVVTSFSLLPPLCYIRWPVNCNFSVEFNFPIVATPLLLLSCCLVTAIANAAATALQHTAGWLSSILLIFSLPQLPLILSFFCCMVTAARHHHLCAQKLVDCSLFCRSFSPCCCICTTDTSWLIVLFLYIVATSLLSFHAKAIGSNTSLQQTTS